MRRFPLTFILLTFAIGCLILPELCHTSADFAYARKVKLKLKTPTDKKGQTTTYQKRIAPVDSLELISLVSMIQFSGFDKAASSSKESFLVTNNSDRHISGLEIELTYRDMSDRMLHKRLQTLTLEIPPSETRMATIKAFDAQKSLYYFRSNPPRKGGIPFKVSISITSISTPL